MRKLSFCILLAFPAMTACFGRPDKKLKEVGEQVQRKEFGIVDGNQVDQGTEHVKSLGLNSVVQIGVASVPGGQCTATRIGTRYFLTAAHCADDFEEAADYNVTIRRGSNASTMQVIKGLRLARFENDDFIHPGQTTGGGMPGRNDVAVLVLQPQTFTPASLEDLDNKLKDIDIAEYGDPVYSQRPGMTVRTAGYGFTKLFDQIEPQGEPNRFWVEKSGSIFSWVDINLGYGPMEWLPMPCKDCALLTNGVVWTNAVDLYEPTPANMDAVLQKKTRIVLLKRRAAEILERLMTDEASEEEYEEFARLQMEIAQLESIYGKYKVQAHHGKNYLVNSPQPSIAGGDSGGPLFYNGKVVAVTSGVLSGEPVKLTNDLKNSYLFNLVTPQPVLIPELEDSTLTRVHSLSASIDKYWVEKITQLPVIDHIASDEEVEKSIAGSGPLNVFQGEWITVVGNNLLNQFGRLNADEISFGKRDYIPSSIKFVSIKASSSQSAVQAIKILIPNDADTGNFRFKYRDWTTGKTITPVAARKIVVKPKEWVLFSELSVKPDPGFPRQDYEDFVGSHSIWSSRISSKWDTESKKSYALHELESSHEYFALVTNRFISRSTQGEIIDDRFFRPEIYAIGYKSFTSDLNVTSPKTFEDATSMYELSYLDTWNTWGTPQTKQISGRRYIRQIIRDAESLDCDLEIAISVPERFTVNSVAYTDSVTKSGRCIGYPTGEMMLKYLY